MQSIDDDRREIILREDIIAVRGIFTACLITENQFVFATVGALLRQRQCQIKMVLPQQLPGAPLAVVTSDVIIVDLTDMEKSQQAVRQILPPAAIKTASLVLALSPFSQIDIWPELSDAGYDGIASLPLSPQRFLAVFDPIFGAQPKESQSNP